MTIGENFQERFKNLKIINLGLSGDTVSGVKSRSHIIQHFKPELIFIECGVNSLVSNNVNTVATEYDALVNEIAEQNPNSKIFLQSVLPVSNSNQTKNLTNENINKLNEKIIAIAEKYGATYIDLHSVYVLFGEMNPEYTIDGIHLNDKSKNLWLDTISPYLSIE